MATNISKLTIRATPEKVWETLTQPAFVKLWQYGSQLKTNWKVGSEIKFVTEWEGKVFEQWGKVLEFSPPVRLRYSLFAPRPDLEDKPENYFEMIYEVKAVGDQTHVEIIQEDHRPNAVQEPQQGEENPILKLLKQVAEA